MQKYFVHFGIYFYQFIFAIEGPENENMGYRTNAEFVIIVYDVPTEIYNENDRNKIIEMHYSMITCY